MRSNVAEEAKKNKIDLNVPTLAAGAGATITMSIVGSYLGPLGTVGGAAATSVVTAVVTAVYKHSATVAQERAKRLALRRLTAVYVADERLGRLNDAEQTALRTAQHEVIDAQRERRRWHPKRLALAGTIVAAGLFGGVALAETGVEALAGKPVAAIVQGKPGSGTSLGGGHVAPASPTPTNPVVPSATPHATSGSTATSPDVVTPSATQSPVTVPPVPPVLPSPQTSGLQNASTAPPQGGAKPSSGG